MGKHYLIVSGSIRNEQKVNEYKNSAGPLMKKFGGVMPPESFKVTGIIAGELRPQFLLRVEFPALVNIQEAFNSEEYLKLISTRDEGYSNLSIYCVEE